MIRKYFRECAKEAPTATHLALDYISADIQLHEGTPLVCHETVKPSFQMTTFLCFGCPNGRSRNYREVPYPWYINIKTGSVTYPTLNTTLSFKEVFGEEW